MYKYVGDISVLAQNIIENYNKVFSVAIDATLGNGHDTDFLKEKFEKVYAFDIQEIACNNYKLKEIKNVIVFNESHDKLKELIKENVDCIMYNLGFLPGYDKSVTTLVSSTMKSLECGLEILNPGGLITICIYPGHSEGKVEETCILEFVKNLNKKEFGVMIHKYLNRSETAPLLVVIEKNEL